MKRIAVLGGSGRMGRAAVAAIAAEPSLELVAVVSRNHGGTNIADLVPDVSGVVVGDAIEALDASEIDCLVDLTAGEAVPSHMSWAAAAGLDIVIGASGVSSDALNLARSLFETGRCLVVPNFAIGAVLMMRFAELAAPLFDTVEIVELHHNNKIDAPSGTASATAARIAAASSVWAPDPTTQETVEGARGGRVEGIAIHSIRMSGMLAHQEVMFGSNGQTLTIRHDTTDRLSFMPGVIVAVSRINQLDAGLTVGLDALLGI